jgi:CRP-like cAMP-binding protein
MEKNVPRQSANRILLKLPPKQFALLKPHLSAVDLAVRTKLECRNTRIENIYFMEHGIASVVACGPGGRTIEVGIIGREGMTGLAVLLGDDRSPHDTFMQVAGDGQRMSADKLRHAMDRSAALRATLLRCAHAFHIQTTRTNLANGRTKIEQRLARWLLMADDRIDDDELPLTHEFLSMMLGVGRAGVTVAMRSLEGSGFITTKRGLITVIDRQGLIESSDGIYIAPEGGQRMVC